MQTCNIAALANKINNIYKWSFVFTTKIWGNFFYVEIKGKKVGTSEFWVLSLYFKDRKQFLHDKFEVWAKFLFLCTDLKFHSVFSERFSFSSVDQSVLFFEDHSDLYIYTACLKLQICQASGLFCPDNTHIVIKIKLKKLVYPKTLQYVHYRNLGSGFGLGNNLLCYWSQNL